MKMKFEIGHEYEANDPGLGEIKVIGRTAQFIKVQNAFGNRFRMKVREDEDGVEYAFDSSVGNRWREAATYKAIWEI